MNRFQEPRSGIALQALERAGLVTCDEASQVGELLADPELAPCVARAETLHLHIKVEDTNALPVRSLEAAGARLDHGRDGFVKYRFPDGVNAIFSHIAVSADDLRETCATRRPRPFLDHIGIDLRDASPASRALFDAVPMLACMRGWGYVGQGGKGRAVRCCHTEVDEKHWLFPDGAVPLEVAFGPLVERDGTAGCDLRPSDPSRASSAAPVPCCAG